MFSRIVLVLTVAATVAGCGGAETDAEAKQVVAAFYPLAFAAEQIAGDAVEVTNLTPPGVEPHDLEISAGDVRTLREAELVLFLGGGFQPAVERAVAGRHSAVDLLETQPSTDAAAEMLVQDPHVWLDPRAYARIVRRIGHELDGEDGAEQLALRVESLDAELERGLGRCRRRDVVTSHAAFGHLARRYGLRQVALQGLAPEAEPTPRDLERLVDDVRRAGATTVFFEPLVAPDLAETVARETGAATATLDPLEGLSEADVARGADYFSVMRDNLAALRRALDCT